MSGTEFASWLEGLRRELRAKGSELDVLANPPVSEAAIAACETALGMQLPAAFRSFLSTCDGISLDVNREPGISRELTIYGTDEIAEEHRQLGWLFADTDRDGETIFDDLGRTSERFWDGLIAFAYHEAGLCVFDTSSTISDEYVVLDLDVDDPRGTRGQVIANSFEDWLGKIAQSAVDSGSFVYWVSADPQEFGA